MTDLRKKKELFASDVELKNVLLHIQQDCAEKIEEIEVKTDEEFEAEKYREIMNHVHSIELSYEEKEQRVKKGCMVDYIAMKNFSRMEQVRHRHAVIKNIIEEVKQRLKNEDGKRKYRELLSLLLMEGLLKMLESKVKIWCRERDVPIIYDISRKVSNDYTEKTGIKVSVTVDKDRSISNKETGGGLILVSENYKVSLCNTMFSRIERVAYFLQPFIYILLFKDQISVTKKTKTHETKLTMSQSIQSVSEISYIL